jgi:alcohol dehydrogenase class IV
MIDKNFDFSTSNQIIFGNGKLQVLSEIIKALGQRALIIKGNKNSDPGVLFNILNSAGVDTKIFSVNQEPDVQMIECAIMVGRKFHCDLVIGFGGGAVIDTGKAVAAMLNNEGNLMDYLEVVGKGKPLKNPSLPYIAIPTTAGTGSEVTKNAVIAVPEKKVKVSLRNAYLLPRVAIVDPELTLTVPKNVTASTGMDAFTQVIEPYVTKNPNPLVDMFCREAIPIAAEYLYLAYSEGINTSARESMAYVSLLGGLSLANAKLGAVHGFAGPIGGMFHAPHGMICAALLPATMQVNAEILAGLDKNDGKSIRFKEIAQWVCGNKNAKIEDGVKWISELAKSMHIPGLSDFGISSADFPSIIEKAEHSSSMKGNPIELSKVDMERILALSM